MGRFEPLQLLPLILQKQRQDYIDQLAAQKQAEKEQSLLLNAAQQGIDPSLFQALTPNVDPQARSSIGAIFKAQQKAQAEGTATQSALTVPSLEAAGQLYNAGDAQGVDRIAQTISPEVQPAFYALAGARSGGLQYQQAQQIAEERRRFAQQQALQVSGANQSIRAEAAGVSMREAATNRQQDLEAGSQVYGFGTTQDQAQFADAMVKKYGDKAKSMLDAAYVRGIGDRAKTLGQRAIVPETAGPIMDAEALAQYRADPNNEQAGDYLFARKLAMPDPAAPPGAPRYVVGMTTEAANKRSGIIELQSLGNRIEQAMNSIENDPNAASQVTGIGGADVFQNLRRATASQNPKVAQLATYITRAVRASARISDVGNLSETDILMAKELMPLMTEIIDPNTGKVSAAARGRIQALRQITEDMRLAIYDPQVRNRLLQQAQDATAGMTDAQRDAMRNLMDTISSGGDVRKALDEASRVGAGKQIQSIDRANQFLLQNPDLSGGPGAELR